MFDRNKIILNHLRAFNTENKKVVSFLNQVYSEASEKLSIKKDRKINILELYARNFLLNYSLNKQRINYTIYKTTTIDKLKFNEENSISLKSGFSNIKEKYFDLCISLFPIVSDSDLPKVLNFVYRALSKGGKCLFIFHSTDSCLKLKKIFYKYFDSKKKNSFLPCFDIMSLGNNASSVGFKNVVVDKSRYFITSKNISEVWQFIRDMGESNYTSDRNKKYIGKQSYRLMTNDLKKHLLKNNKITNEVSINYLMGIKKN